MNETPKDYTFEQNGEMLVMLDGIPFRRYPTEYGGLRSQAEEYLMSQGFSSYEALEYLRKLPLAYTIKRMP